MLPAVVVVQSRYPAGVDAGTGGSSDPLIRAMWRGRLLDGDDDDDVDDVLRVVAQKIGDWLSC